MLASCYGLTCCRSQEILRQHGVKNGARSAGSLQRPFVELHVDGDHRIARDLVGQAERLDLKPRPMNRVIQLGWYSSTTS